VNAATLLLLDEMSELRGEAIGGCLGACSVLVGVVGAGVDLL
jgi:hypothetical protein